MGVRGEIGGRKENLSIRVSRKEADLLRSAAAASGVSLSWFILRAALAATPPATPSGTVGMAVWDRR